MAERLLPERLPPEVEAALRQRDEIISALLAEIDALRAERDAARALLRQWVNAHEHEILMEPHPRDDYFEPYYLPQKCHDYPDEETRARAARTCRRCGLERELAPIFAALGKEQAAKAARRGG